MDPNVHDAEGNSPLLNAAAAGHVQVVRLLVEKGAAVNVANDRGMTPLSGAVLNGHTRVVAALVDSGADLSAPTVDRMPLMLAIRARRADVVKLLLDKGAHAYVQDDTWSALMLAS